MKIKKKESLIIYKNKYCSQKLIEQQKVEFQKLFHDFIR